MDASYSSFLNAQQSTLNAQQSTQFVGVTGNEQFTVTTAFQTQTWFEYGQKV